jgi:predicted O-methyltransferase YrrM
MSIRFVIKYIQHRLGANTRHGTHSPFVYQLADEVIYDFSAKKVYQPIEDLRKKNLANPHTITVTDLGAGSMLNKNRTKKVAEIAKNALKSPKLAQLIYRIAANHPAQELIELGTCLGITSAYLAAAQPNKPVITVEGCPATAQIAQQNFKDLSLSQIELLVGNFDQILPNLLAQRKQVDFVYIDGNHTKAATLHYFQECLAKAHEGTLLIFDDIYWSKGMEEAWEEIKNHPQVTVTVDLFWIGLVYFKKGQAKEHFKLKY